MMILNRPPFRHFFECLEKHVDFRRFLNNCEGGMAKLIVNLFLLLPIVVFGFLGVGSATSNVVPNRNFAAIAQAVDKEGAASPSQGFFSRYGETVLSSSEKYGLDWRLVLAVMRVESSFRPKAESGVGAEGFMQIMPVTQLQLADELGYDDGDISHPHRNIEAGTYYLAKLYSYFANQGRVGDDCTETALAAYNAGINRVQDAMDVARYMNDNPKDWKSIRRALPFLSRKYASLHPHIWNDGRPPFGYFTQWRQTTKYVDSVMKYYKKYCKEFAGTI